MKNRAQITMESLLLYGAAILVVLLAIAALTYFGVFDLGNLFPDKCDFGSSGTFVCEEWKVDTSGNLDVVLKNTGSKAIDVNNVTITSDLGSCTSTWLPAAAITIAPGNSGKVSYTCAVAVSSLSQGDKIKLSVILDTKLKGGQIDTVTHGELQTKLS